MAEHPHRIEQQQTWVDVQVRQAMARGEFDDLPGAGKPIPDLDNEYDPDPWVKRLVERERVAVLPPALAIRTEDAELDGLLDRLNSEPQVRREVEEFNARVRTALYTPPTGPFAHPVITSKRDVEGEVAAWRARRTERMAAQRAQLAAQEPPPRPRRWWRGVGPRAGRTAPR